MASLITFNQLIEVIKDIAQRHYQINSFFLGRNWELENQKQDVIYPVLQVWPESSRLPQNQYNEYKIHYIDLKFRILDLVFQGEENEKDVHSDTLQIARDILNEINRHPYYQRSNVQVVGDISLTPQEEQGTDITAGWEFTLTIKLLNYNSFCGLPFKGIDGFSVPGPEFTAVTYNTQYLTCQTVTACTTLQNYIANEISQIPIPTADTSQFLYKINTQDDLYLVWSSGSIDGFDLTNNGDGSVTIGTGTTLLRTSASEYAPIETFTLSSSTILTLTDNSVNYIYTDYNLGNPVVTAGTSISSFNCLDKCIIYKATRSGNTIYWLFAGEQNVDSNKKLRRRFLESENIFRANGLMLGSRFLTINTTAGKTYFGLTPHDVEAFNTNTGDIFTQIYSSGLNWVYSTGTTINNTQYNNNGVLTTMTNNHYRVDYIYLLIDSPNKLYVYLGDTQYNTLAQANLSTTPSSLPVELANLGLLIGRVIVQKNAAILAEVQSSFNVVFTTSNVTNHNELSGLQGGTSNEYYHLTQNEYNNKVIISGSPIDGQAPIYSGGTWVPGSVSTGPVNIPAVNLFNYYNFI